MRLLLLVVLTLTVGCLKLDSVGTSVQRASLEVDAESSPYVERREASRKALEKSCGACHIGETGGNAGALRVFDLSEEDRAARLTPEQAADVVRRLGEPTAPSGAENPATPEDVEIVRAYLSE